MFGKKSIVITLIAAFVLQAIVVGTTLEAGEKELVFTAKPLSTKEFRDEWHDYRLTYLLVYAFAYGAVLFK
jgi:hypothetical protein